MTVPGYLKYKQLLVDEIVWCVRSTVLLGLLKTLRIVWSFQYGRENIEIAKKDRHAGCDNSENEDEGQGDTKQTFSRSVTSHYTNDSDDKKLKNGVLANNSTSVISRDDLILVPDPEQNYSSANNNMTSEDDHAAVTHVSRVNRMLSHMKNFDTFICIYEWYSGRHVFDVDHTSSLYDL
jgi:hypothetical protein